VEDIQKLMAYGVMMTPALVVEGKVKLTARYRQLKTQIS